MVPRNKTARKNKGVGLTAEEKRAAATQMMAGAQAHQRTSVWCTEKPDAKPPNIDAFLFQSVSLELLLLSIEQSLRLLLLLHYSMIPNNTNHNPRVLYVAMKRKSGGTIGIRQDIITTMDAVGQTRGIAPFSETELEACLGKHNSSYSNLRYFQVDREGRLTGDWDVVPRDIQILNCFALALIILNGDEMQKQGIGIWQSMSPTPESEMTEELKALKERLMSR